MHRDSPLGSRAATARVVGGLACVLALLTGLLVGPAAAQQPPATTTTTVDEDPPKTEAELQAAREALLKTLALAPESPPAADDPFAEVVRADDHVQEAALARLQATAEANDANLAAFAAAGELDQARAREQAARRARDAAEDELGVERKRMSDLTVQAYVSTGEIDIDKYQAYLQGDTTDPETGRQIMFGQVVDVQERVTEAATRALRKAEAKLADAKEVTAAATDKTSRLVGVAADRTKRQVQAEVDHLQAVADAAAARDALRTASAAPIELVPEDVPIIGLPRLTAEDLAGWFAQSSYRPRVTTPIEDYATWFIEEGRAEGIRGDIAFAQAVLETGGFANTDSVEGNNFSGIGHYDNLARGWSFPSPRLGVRAQIQLLKSYAVRDPDYANPLVDKRLRGPAGCCQTWGDLTTVWATDPTYGPKVMLLYTSLVDYALQRRARGEGLEPTDPSAASGDAPAGTAPPG